MGHVTGAIAGRVTWVAGKIDQAIMVERCLVVSDNGNGGLPIMYLWFASEEVDCHLNHGTFGYFNSLTAVIDIKEDIEKNLYDKFEIKDRMRNYSIWGIIELLARYEIGCREINKKLYEIYGKKE